MLGWDEERFPLILGPRILGHIAEIGETAAAHWGVKQNDRVVVEQLFGCGHCSMCLIGEYRFCEEHRGYGYMRIDSPPYLWGGYGRYMYLAPNSRVHRISEDVPAAAAAMTCANIGNGIRWVRTKGGVTIGDSVVVLGPGGQGLAAVLAAHHAGAAQVIAVGITRDEHRFELARLFGATHTVDLQKEDPIQRVRELTDGKMADIVRGPDGRHRIRAPFSGTGAHHGHHRHRVQHGIGSSRDYAQPAVYQRGPLAGGERHDTPAVRAAIKVIESRRYPSRRWSRTASRWTRRRKPSGPPAARSIWMGSSRQPSSPTRALSGELPALVSPHESPTHHTSTGEETDMKTTWDYLNRSEYVQRIVGGMPPVIVTAAVTGGHQKAENPNVPVTAEEQAAAAAATFAAGARIIHITPATPSIRPKTRTTQRATAGSTS